MKITKDAYKISHISNVYVITGDIPTVIDTGEPGDQELIKKEIEKIISPDEIKRVILTHLHYDHCGAVGLFKNARIYASAEEIKDFRKDPHVFFSNYLCSNSLKILREKLEVLPDSFGDLDVVKVPGHTRGSIALVDEKRKLLFSGDTLFENGIGRTDLANSVPEKMDESLKKLIGLIKEKDLVLCPGHDY